MKPEDIIIGGVYQHSKHPKIKYVGKFIKGKRKGMFNELSQNFVNQDKKVWEAYLKQFWSQFRLVSKPAKKRIG